VISSGMDLLNVVLFLLFLSPFPSQCYHVIISRFLQTLSSYTEGSQTLCYHDPSKIIRKFTFGLHADITDVRLHDVA
jgi:hypothetical protein